jgi:hypothetical protein
MKRLLLAVLAGITTAMPLVAAHPEAPAWMHALVGVPLPAHDEKTKAVLLYSEENLTVLSADKFQTTVRKAYKILRPEGRDYGDIAVEFDSLNEKVTKMRGWCIPAAGKDYEVTDKDALEVSPLKDEGDALITDERVKFLRIPAADPGNIVGFEYVKDQHPLFLQDEWDFQRMVPVRESHYSLSLPAGWEFKDAWVNYPEVKAHDAGSGLWQWSVGEVKAVRPEEDMPPWEGVAGRMVVTLFPPGGAAANNSPTWHDVGEWDIRLTSDRLNASPEIKQEVSTLAAAAPTPLGKMRALAGWVQRDIRYVAIELGIGGWQPHPAPQIFAHRYGDCKDKATLLRTMLREIGVESYFVDINVDRGSVEPQSPPGPFGFNHVMVAIKLPDGLTDPALIATMKHPKLGTLLFFDPTDRETPFGQIRGELQANYGLLVAPAASELVELPQQPAEMNSVRRSANLTLGTDGMLQGTVEEVRVGDFARQGRGIYKSIDNSKDQIKPVEHLLADSLGAFQITKASIGNLQQTDQPFVWNYSFQAANYAKAAGSLVLVRPRVLGVKSRGLVETREPRLYPIEFDGPEKDTDSFDITLPPGYVVDDLPPAVDADYPFASYHAKTEVAGNTLHYRRTYEVKQLSVPASQAADLRKFYRMIAADEKNNAVLKQAAH